MPNTNPESTEPTSEEKAALWRSFHLRELLPVTIKLILAIKYDLCQIN
jgi:hypothetical protein